MLEEKMGAELSPPPSEMRVHVTMKQPIQTGRIE